MANFHPTDRTAADVIQIALLDEVLMILQHTVKDPERCSLSVHFLFVVFMQPFDSLQQGHRQVFAVSNAPQHIQSASSIRVLAFNAAVAYLSPIYPGSPATSTV